MREKHRADREYPKSISYNIGDVFSRPPKEIHFNITKGSYPLYGRSIEMLDRVSEHKLILHLGSFCDEKTDGRDCPTRKAVISVYGELDKFVSLGYMSEDDEFAKLWLDEDDNKKEIK